MQFKNYVKIILHSMFLCTIVEVHAADTSAGTTQTLTDEEKARLAELKKEYQKENWEQPGFRECLDSGSCANLVECPANQACFNNCIIGQDTDVTGRAVGAFFAGIFGQTVETDARYLCLAQCIQKKSKMCAGPQPIDYTKEPPTSDPAKQCREFCGASLKSVDGLFNQCERTCAQFDNLSACFRLNPVPESLNGQSCDPAQQNIVLNPSGDYQVHRNEVAMMMKAFGFDSKCTLSRERGLPEEGGCRSICTIFDNFDQTRNCLQQTAITAAENEARNAQQQSDSDIAVQKFSESEKASEGQQKASSALMKALEQTNKELDQSR
jgi:hypothetical protein